MMVSLDSSGSGDVWMGGLWEYFHGARGAGVRGFSNGEISVDFLLLYFPLAAAAVNAIFLIVLIEEVVRHEYWTPYAPVKKELGMLHSKAKLICGGLYFICALPLLLPLSSEVGFALSTYEVVFYLSDALALLSMCVVFQRQENQLSAVFHNIVRAWLVAFLVLSALTFGAAVLGGSMLKAVFTFLPFILSLLEVIICFTGHVYRGEHCAESDDLKTSFLRESSKESANQAPVSSGFSRAGVFSILSFTWLNPLLSAGNEKPLHISDVPLLDPEDDANRNFKAFQERWEKDISNSLTETPPTILWTLLRTFWKPFTLSVILTIVWTIAMFVGPILQNLLITFMEEKHRTFAKGSTLVLILLSGKLVEAFSVHQLSFRSRKLGLQMWAGVSRAVYNKALRLSLQARQVRSLGEITNILSTDVQRLLELIYYVQQGVAFPLQLVISVIVLFKVVGVAMLAGLSTLVVIVIVNIFNVRRMRRFKMQVLQAKDKRMQVTTECLGNMKVLKLQAWDVMFKQRIELLRDIERRWVQTFMYSWATNIFMVWSGPMAVSALTFFTMVVIGEPLTTARVFTALTTFRIIQEPIRFIPDVTANFIQASVSLRRVRAFLMEDEVDKNAVERVFDNSINAVHIERASFSWDKQGTAPAINDLTLEIKKGTCVAICGSVGSGKSSLLYCILGELPKISGTVKLSGRVAYVAQSAWIQNNTVQENILFGRSMDLKRYNEAVRVSGLESDLAQFPYGDKTEIGERGTNLSGGQKQRVQLARAVYQDADIYLLDDPFSAVDAHTGTFLFEECVRGALRHKTVILITHQVEFLPAADLIIVMKAPGQIVQKGTYSQLVEEGKDFGAFVGALKDSLESVNRATQVRAEDISDDEGTILLDGKIDSSLVTTWDENSSAKLSKRQSSLRKGGSKITSEIVASESTKFIQDELRATGRVHSEVVWAYLTKVGNGFLCLLVLIPQVTTMVSQIGSDVWLAQGTSDENVSTLRFIEIYILLVLACSLSVLWRTLMVAYAGVATSQAYFTGMLNSIFRAPMSFMDSTPLGRILSRCSTDQATLDMELPNTSASVGNSATALIGSILITIVITPRILFLIVPLGLMYFDLRTYYINSSRELSRLTAMTEAPVFLHVGETIAGTITIRAFQEQMRFEDTNANRLESYQRSSFHNIASSEWLGLRLDSVAAIVLSTAAILLITVPEGTVAPGSAGMELSYGLTLGTIMMRLVNASCNFENKMISVERVTQYSEILSEAPAVIPGRRPPSGWPDKGRIDLQRLQVSYRPGLPLVLKGISCVIYPGEKVGVVGRTGSGKSTLIQALFRLMEPAGGRIVVDGIDITTIGLADLRSNLGVIPQEPTLFEGTVRSNLDPFNIHTDEQIWETLKKCELTEVVELKPGKLDSSVSEQGENWSVGQRQLLCLGRALLKHARILVLDEATASVDITTDAVIQTTIKKYFADSTVISVAHRIPTVIDSDRVLVLDNGHLMENNSPEHLLANENSMFSKLVQEYTQRSGSSSTLDSLDVP